MIALYNAMAKYGMNGIFAERNYQFEQKNNTYRRPGNRDNAGSVQ